MLKYRKISAQFCEMGVSNVWWGQLRTDWPGGDVKCDDGKDNINQTLSPVTLFSIASTNFHPV